VKRGQAGCDAGAGGRSLSTCGECSELRWQEAEGDEWTESDEEEERMLRTVDSSSGSRQAALMVLGVLL
jgi:hypothetical protein